MIRCRAVMLIFLSLLLAPKLVSQKSGTMSTQQYTALLENLNSAVSSWKAQIGRLYKIDLPVNIDRHEQIQGPGFMAVVTLGQMKGHIQAEQDYPELAMEIIMMDTLTAARDQLKQSTTDLPDFPNREAWIRSATSIQEEISKYIGQLHAHVINKAYEVQDEIEACQARSKK